MSFLLVEDRMQSYLAARRNKACHDNRLIFGENGAALALLQDEFAGRIECIYIDPPYNTGATFDHYDDRADSAAWRLFLRRRLELLRPLLAPPGAFFLHIDDKELAAARLVCDEVFGRPNFLNMIVVKTSDPSGLKTANPSPFSQTEYILMYAKDRRQYRYRPQWVPCDYDPSYNRVIVNPSAPMSRWRFAPIAQAAGREDRATFALRHAERVFQLTAISDAAGRRIVETRDRSAAQPGTVFCVERPASEPVFVLNGRQMVFYGAKVKTIDGRRTAAKPLTNLWTDIPWNGIAAEGGVVFKNGKKPERLLRRCIEMSTEPGDWVLDAFAGSGTTGAVAQKLGRRWILIESGGQCLTHCLPRLRRVADGSDQAGISRALGWKGGGGFRFSRVAATAATGWGVLTRDA